MVGMDQGIDAERRSDLVQVAAFGGVGIAGTAAAHGISRIGHEDRVTRQAGTVGYRIPFTQKTLSVPVFSEISPARSPHARTAVALVGGLAVGLGAALIENHLTGPGNEGDARNAMGAVGGANAKVEPVLEDVRTKDGGTITTYDPVEIADRLVETYDVDRDEAIGPDERTRELHYTHNGDEYTATASIAEHAKLADSVGPGSFGADDPDVRAADGKAHAPELANAVNEGRRVLTDDSSDSPTELERYQERLGERIEDWSRVGD